MRPSRRDELVKNALTIFYRNGFHATGMDLLASETGISKTSMYKYFRTKEDLILAVLRLRDENFRNWITRRMEALAATPKEQLLAMFDALREWFAEDSYRSCMFIKASGEYPDPSHPIHVQSTEHKRLLFVYVRDLATQAGARDPEALAQQLMILKEGAIVIAHFGHTADPAGEAKAAAEVLVASQIS